MASGKPSKTSKAAVQATANKNKTGFIRAADASLLLPTGGEGNTGRYTYVYTAAGKTVHTNVGSDKFYAEVASLIEAGYEERIMREIATLADVYSSFKDVQSKLAADVAVEPETMSAA